MYVNPFWSYRASTPHAIITNHLSMRETIVPFELIDLLATIYQSTSEAAAPRRSELVKEARLLDLLFDDYQAADNWFRQFDESTGRQIPRLDQIELTNRCPYSCKMCPRTLSMDRGLGNMPLELFQNIIQQISRHQNYVALHHFGESLIHPQLADAVEFASRHGVLCGISCNPPSLKPAIAANLLRARLANILFSFDSLDPITYRSIRGPAADFNRGDANLRAFMRMRNESGVDTCATLQMISMDCNHQEADHFLDYCREVGVDRGVVIRLGRWDFEDSYVATLGVCDAPGHTAYCQLPWNSAVVLWDGRMVPCCHDYNGEVVLGDLQTHTLKEIWASDAAALFRRDNYHTSLCRNCAFSRSFREHQREKEGFHRFHLERTKLPQRKEWINPASRNLIDGASLFNRFDVVDS